MGVVLALISVIGVVATVAWRISMAARAARDVADAAEGIANLPRKMRFQSRAKKAGVAVIDDAREAAALLMLSVARAGGEVTAEEKAAIRAQMIQRFEMAEDEADEMLTQVAWLSKDLPEAGSAADKMTDVVLRAVTEKELIELHDMLHHVSKVDGAPTPDQLALIDRYRSRAGV